MLKLIGETSVDVRRTWINPGEMLKHGLHFTAQHPILLLEATAQIDLVSHALSVTANSISTILQVLDVFNGYRSEVSK